jgi:hypothetical protein
MTSTTPLPPPRVSIPLLSGRGLRLAGLAGRAATICLLMPVVLLLAVTAFLGLALLGTAQLARAGTASLRADTRAAAADVHFYASATAERVESVAIRQAA